jgi:hypothetical protein
MIVKCNKRFDCPNTKCVCSKGINSYPFSFTCFYTDEEVSVEEEDESDNVYIDDFSYKPKSNEGTKFDDGKLRWDLLPFDALEEIVKVYTYGSKKYGDYNYLGGIKYSRIIGAMFRHFKAWWSGENIDEESGLPHLSHMAWNVITLLVFSIRNRKELDDRKNK